MTHDPPDSAEVPIEADHGGTEPLREQSTSSTWAMIWWANVVASYGTALVLLANAFATATVQGGGIGFKGPGELFLAFAISPLSVPLTTAFSTVMVVVGSETPSYMHLVTPTVYVALFVVAQARFRRRALQAALDEQGRARISGSRQHADLQGFACRRHGSH